MKHKFIYILLTLTVIAFAVRLAVSIELAGYHNGFNQVIHPAKSTDMAVYKDLAEKIAGGGFKGSYYFQPFYYAVFLPMIKLLFGDSIWPLLIVQSLLGAITVYLTGLCAALLWNRAAGIIAAVLTLFSAALILYTPFMLIETLQVFWIMLLLYLALRAVSTRKIIFWLLAALVCGCAILTRGNAWFFVPGLLVAVFLTAGRKSPAKQNTLLLKIALPVIFVCLVLLPQLPFAWRNTMLAGKLTGPSTASAAVLALGNTPEAPPGGRNPGLPAGPMEYPPSYHAWTSTANEISIPRRIIQWIAAEPLAYAELTFRKLLLFWDYQEIPNNISFVGEGTQSTNFQFTGIVPTGIIMAFGLAGMMLLTVRMFRKRELKSFLVIYFILAFWAATAIFYILCRFRLPVIPLLAICAAVLVNHFWRLRLKNSRRAYFTTFPLLIIAVFVCFTAYDYYRQYLESSIIRIVRPNGVVMEMSPGRFMFLDNGPFSFGGWDVVELQPGAVIQKNFPAAASVRRDFKYAELELTLIFDGDGSAVFEINGESKTVSRSKAGNKDNTELLTIPFNSDGSVNIKLVSADTKISCVIDRQRNYSRTLINGENPGGELVCRLYCSAVKPAH
jgi:4-amino-4-deoxy-L-arabinose transferase-like glycosyltransferase